METRVYRVKDRRWSEAEGVSNWQVHGVRTMVEPRLRPPVVSALPSLYSHAVGLSWDAALEEVSLFL